MLLLVVVAVKWYSGASAVGCGGGAFVCRVLLVITTVYCKVTPDR